MRQLAWFAALPFASLCYACRIVASPSITSLCEGILKELPFSPLRRVDLAHLMPPRVPGLLSQRRFAGKGRRSFVLFGPFLDGRVIITIIYSLLFY